MSGRPVQELNVCTVALLNASFLGIKVWYVFFNYTHSETNVQYTNNTIC